MASIHTAAGSARTSSSGSTRRRQPQRRGGQGDDERETERRKEKGLALSGPVRDDVWGDSRSEACSSPVAGGSGEGFFGGGGGEFADAPSGYRESRRSARNEVCFWGCYG